MMEAEIGLMHLQSGVYWNPQKTGEASRARALRRSMDMPTFSLRILICRVRDNRHHLKAPPSCFLVMAVENASQRSTAQRAPARELLCLGLDCIDHVSLGTACSPPVSHSEISPELTPLTEGSLAGRRGSLCIPIPGLCGLFSASWSSVMGMPLPHILATMNIAVSSLAWWIATLENLEPQ